MTSARCSQLIPSIRARFMGCVPAGVAQGGFGISTGGKVGREGRGDAHSALRGLDVRLCQHARLLIELSDVRRPEVVCVREAYTESACRVAQSILLLPARPSLEIRASWARTRSAPLSRALRVIWSFARVSPRNDDEELEHVTSSRGVILRKGRGFNRCLTATVGITARCTFKNIFSSK